MESDHNHCNEGIKILLTNPKVNMLTILYMIAVLVGGAVIWSFFGKADVVIACDGVVTPIDEPHQVYTPVSGEIVDIYFIEGETVTKGTVMARIKSPEAITLAGKAQTAVANYDIARREAALVPTQKALLEKQLTLLRKKKDFQTASIGDAEEQLKTFDEAQKLKTEIIQDRIRRADDAIKLAQDNYQRYKTMFEAGAVSQKEYQDQEVKWKQATDNSKSERLRASAEYAQALDNRRERALELDAKRNKVLETDMQIRELEEKIATMDQEVKSRLKIAKIAVDATSQITLKDLDTQNLLEIRAPVTGVITTARFTQTGEMVSATKPIFTISPQRERCLLIEISDHDRAFVAANQPVKIKVNAFPYMRFGLLSGRVHSISPTAITKPGSGAMLYEAKIFFDKDRKTNAPLDYFEINNQKQRVHYGMTAVAEIVIDRRRLVEFALDSFRNEKP